MAQQQQSCPDVASMLTSDSLHIASQVVSGVPVMGDVSTGVFHPLEPAQMCEAVFQSLHSIHHPRVRAKRRLITARFCWPQMAKSVTLMARACLFCQWDNVHRHIQLNPAVILVLHHHFAHIHIDIVGLIPPYCGHMYLHCDRQASRWPEAISSPPSLPLTVPEPYSPAGSPILECQP
jgi:hypothetical protein